MYDELVEVEKSVDTLEEAPKGVDTIEHVEKGVDNVEHVEKFNPFHDAQGKFSSSRGYKSYSANPKTKAGAMAISRSTRAGYGAVMNVHRESKGENIYQNDVWINSGKKPTPSAMARAQANNPNPLAARGRARTNRVKGTMGAVKEGQTTSRPTTTQKPTQPQQTAPKPTPKATQPQQTQQSQQSQQAQPKAGTVHVTQKMRSGITMDTDFDTSKVAGAKNKEFRGTAEGKDITKSFDATTMSSSDRYGGAPRYTDKVADMQGFNSPPKVVSKAEFKQLAQTYGDEMFRTWGDGHMNRKSLDGKGFMKEFETNGDMKMNGDSGRVYGDGFYVTSSKMQHGRGGTYTRNDAANARRESRYYGDHQSTTQMTWLSQPKIITNSQLDREWRNLSVSERAKFGDHKNTYACAKGYDAVYTNSSNYMVIFNRSKLAVCEN